MNEREILLRRQAAYQQSVDEWARTVQARSDSLNHALRYYRANVTKLAHTNAQLAALDRKQLEAAV